jgi:transcription initiation factor TFIIIB Brf1 subunit/transcription initiation factor TFIIB
METRMPTLAEVRAADADVLFSLYFPQGRVPAAAAVGCVCVDYLTCSECERILGQSFLAIELAARKKRRTDRPVPVARVDAGTGQGLGLSSHGVDGSDAFISGMADRLEPGSRPHPPSDRVEAPAGAIGSKADSLGTGSHPASDGVEGSDAAISSMADRPDPVSNGGVEGFEAAISGMAARLGLSAAVAERAKEVFRKMDEARAWPHGPGRSKNQSKERSKGPLAYAACLSIACRADGSAVSLRELARAVAADGSSAGRKDIVRLIAHIRRQLGDKAGQSTGVGMVCISAYVRRFGSLVGLQEEESAAALRAARRLEDGVHDVRHSTDIMAAAVVCMTLERAGASRPSVKDVAAAAGVSNMTIYGVCRELRPHAGLLFG